MSKSYDDVLPAPLRLGADLPAQEWWPWRGAQIRIDRYARSDAPATVILLHGGGGHGRLLAPYGRMAAEAGLEAVMPDLPGYGLTRSPRELVRYDAWVACVADLVAREGVRRPVILVGASMGGMLGWHAAALLPRGAVAHVVATTLMDARRPAVRRQVARFGAIGAAAVPVMTATRRLTDDLRLPMPLLGDVGAIANDPAIVARIRADRLGGGGRVPLGFLRSWMTYTPALEPRDWDRAPVLLAHPGDDRWTPTALSLDFFDQLPGPKRFVELENCGHLPVEEPGLSTLRRELQSVAREFDRIAGAGA